MTTGIHALYDDWASMKRGEMNVWEFDEQGVLQTQITTKGLVDNKRGGMYLIEEDGYVHGGNAHVATYEGDIYFVVHSGKLKQNSFQEITSNNSKGLLEDGTYYFGTDCKLFTGIMWNDSTEVYNYYKKGLLQKNTGVIKYEDDYYYVCYSGKLKQNGFQEITSKNNNGLLANGTYYFGKDCKLNNGTDIVWNEYTGVYNYIKNGKQLKNAGAVEHNGDIYFVCYSGKLKQNGFQEVNSANSNGWLENGIYFFGSNCKIDNSTAVVWNDSTEVFNYIKNGQQQKNTGVIEHDGEKYFVCYSGKLKQDGFQNITSANSNGLLTPGSYYFGEDCKLFNGIKEGDDGILYYYKEGKLGNSIYNNELVKINEEIYLVKWSGKVARNEERKITPVNSNGFLESGTYYFGHDGKLLTGVKEDDGVLYYYKEGQVGDGIYHSELIKVNGDIYLVKWSGKVARNETREITSEKAHGLIKPGTYYFDETGKLQ